jgi:hypothetical protein
MLGNSPVTKEAKKRKPETKPTSEETKQTI